MKKKLQERTPKVIELVNVLSSYLDSTMESGQSIGLTKLAKEIEVSYKDQLGHKKTTNPHVNTLRNKLTEGFILRDVLANFKAEYNKNKLVRVIKLEKSVISEELDMSRILNALLQIKEEQIRIRNEIEKFKNK